MPRYFPALFKTMFGLTERQLVAQIQFLKAENEILRSRIPKQIRTTRAERARLIRLGKALGSAITDVITIVKPRTFLGWIRQAEAPTVRRRATGRPPTPASTQELVLRIADETGYGYTRIHGELRKLGIRIARTTIKNILQRHGITPDPHRGEGRWDQFIAAHAQTLWACDFFSVNAWTLRGVRQLTLLLFIHIETRRVIITPATTSPNAAWVKQQAREFCIEMRQVAPPAVRVIRDGDRKFGRAFDHALEREGVDVMRLPWRSPNLNAFAERAIRTVKHECLNQFVVLGEKHLNFLIQEYVRYYNHLRPHSSRGYLPPVQDCADPPPAPPPEDRRLACNVRLGGLLRHYYWKRAA